MYDILCDLFAERMPQDKSYKYKPDTVNVHFENRINATVHQVDVRKTIKEITIDKKYVCVAFYMMKLSISYCADAFVFVFLFFVYSFLVDRGALTFHVTPRGSDAEKRFLTKERTRLNIVKS